MGMETSCPEPALPELSAGNIVGGSRVSKWAGDTRVGGILEGDSSASILISVGRYPLAQG